LARPHIAIAFKNTFRKRPNEERKRGFQKNQPAPGNRPEPSKPHFLHQYNFLLRKYLFHSAFPKE
jgi:hypothetical protein